MKKQAYRLLVIAGLMITLLVASADAQFPRVITADIPFDFLVMDKRLPAGQYDLDPIRMGGIGALRIRSADGQVTAVVLTQSSTARANQAGLNLVFNRVGGQYFLSQVRGIEDKTFHQLPKSRIEKSLANQTGALKRSTVFIIGQHR